MAKIRIIQPTYDRVTNQHYKVGEIIDLGGMRNKKAVETKQAQWVDSEKLAKAEAKGEDVTNMTEKVEVPQGAKKTTTSARGKRIETKTNKNKEADKAILNILEENNNKVIVDNLNSSKKDVVNLKVKGKHLISVMKENK